MNQKTHLSAIQYGEFMKNHEHHEIKVTSFSANRSATFEASLNQDEAELTKRFIIELQNPTEKDAEVEVGRDASHDGIFADRSYLIAEELCECGFHNPIPLKVIRGNIFFVGIGQPICGNEDNEKNRRILKEVFKTVREASEDELIVLLLKSASGRTIQAKNFRTQVREKDAEIAAYKDAIAEKFLAKK